MNDRKYAVATHSTFDDAALEARRIADLVAVLATVEWDDAKQRYGVWIRGEHLRHMGDRSPNLPAKFRQAIVADFCVASDSNVKDARLMIPMTETLARRIRGAANVLLELGQRSLRMPIDEPYTMLLLDADAHEQYMDGYEVEAELTDPSIHLERWVPDPDAEPFVKVTVQASSDCMEPPELLSGPWFEASRVDISNVGTLTRDPREDEPIMCLAHRRYSNITVQRHVCDLHLEINDDYWRRILGTLRAMREYDQRGVTITLPKELCALKPGKKWNVRTHGNPENYECSLGFSWDGRRTPWSIHVSAIDRTVWKWWRIPFMEQTADRDHVESMAFCTRCKTSDWIL